MYLERDAKRIHKNYKVEPEAQLIEVATEEACFDESDVQGKGDPRLLDGVPFEHSAHETFSEEFCVPIKGKSKPKNMKRASNEGHIKRPDLEYLCHTILTQEERRGYWEISPDLWTDEPFIVFEFETVAFVVHCEEKKLVRISAKDVAAILGPCLDSNPENPVIKKLTGTWSSHTDSGKADFLWEIQGPKEGEVGPPVRKTLQQRARSFFRSRA